MVERWSNDWFPLPGQAVFDRDKQQVAAVSRTPGQPRLVRDRVRQPRVVVVLESADGGWAGDWFPLPGQAVFDRDKQHVAAVSRAPGQPRPVRDRVRQPCVVDVLEIRTRLGGGLVPVAGAGGVRPRQAARGGGVAHAREPRLVRDRLRQSRLVVVLESGRWLGGGLVPVAGAGGVRPRQAARGGGVAHAREPRPVRDRVRQSRLVVVLESGRWLGGGLVPVAGAGGVRPRQAARGGGVAYAREPRLVRDRLRQSRLVVVLESGRWLGGGLVPVAGAGGVRPRQAARHRPVAGAGAARLVRDRVRQPRVVIVLEPADRLGRRLVPHPGPRGLRPRHPAHRGRVAHRRKHGPVRPRIRQPRMERLLRRARGGAALGRNPLPVQ